MVRMLSVAMESGGRGAGLSDAVASVLPGVKTASFFSSCNKLCSGEMTFVRLGGVLEMKPLSTFSLVALRVDWSGSLAAKEVKS